MKLQDLEVGHVFEFSPDEGGSIKALAVKCRCSHGSETQAIFRIREYASAPRSMNVRSVGKIEEISNSVVQGQRFSIILDDAEVGSVCDTLFCDRGKILKTSVESKSGNVMVAILDTPWVINGDITVKDLGYSGDYAPIKKRRQRKKKAE